MPATAHRLFVPPALRRAGREFQAQRPALAWGGVWGAEKRATWQGPWMPRALSATQGGRGGGQAWPLPWQRAFRPIPACFPPGLGPAGRGCAPGRRRGFAGAFVRAGEVRFCGLFLRSFTGLRRACWLGCGGALPDGCVNLAFRICLSNQQIARSARGCCEVRYQNRKNLWISAAWKGFARAGCGLGVGRVWAGCEMDAGHCAGAENKPPPCVALLPKSAPGAFAGRAGIASQPWPCAAPFSFASGYKILLIKSANIL